MSTEIVNYTPDFTGIESGTYFFVDTDNKYVFVNWSSDVKKGIERHLEKINMHKSHSNRKFLDCSKEGTMFAGFVRKDFEEGYGYLQTRYPEGEYTYSKL